MVTVISAISSVAFVAVWIDKRRAEADVWRVPESVLHFLELLGGWPGAYLAQRLFRHKTAKLSYRLEFWLILAAYEYAAIDYPAQLVSGHPKPARQGHFKTGHFEGLSLRRHQSQ